MSDLTPPYSGADGQLAVGLTNLAGAVRNGSVESTRLIAEGGPNLVREPGFEHDIVDWSAAASCTIARSTSQAHSGSASLLATRTATSGNAGGSYDKRMPVKADEAYQLELYHRSTASVTAGATCVVTVTGYDAEGGTLGTISVRSGLKASTWARLKHSFFPSAIDPDVASVGLSFVTVNQTFTAGNGIYVDDVSLRSVPYSKANGLVIGSDDDQRMYLFRNEIHGRTADDPCPIELNLANDSAYWSGDSAGRGVYAVDRPLAPVWGYDNLPGPAAPVGAYLDVADRDAGWQWVAYHAQETCTATGYVTITLPADFPTAIVAVTAVELEGFVYTPGPFSFHWMNQSYPGSGPPFGQITLRCYDLAAGGWANSQDIAVGGLVLGY